MSKISSNARERAAKLFDAADLESEIMQQAIFASQAESLASPPFISPQDPAAIQTESATRHTSPLQNTLPGFVHVGAASILQGATQEWRSASAIAKEKLSAHYRKLAQDEAAKASEVAAAAEPFASAQPLRKGPVTILDENGNPIID